LLFLYPRRALLTARKPKAQAYPEEAISHTGTHYRHKSKEYPLSPVW
jgi:hypothetical protein